MDNKIVTARFATDDNYVNVYDVYQWDYGQVLRIEGLKLPNMVEIDFSLQETSGEAKTHIGVTKDGVTDVVIPDSFLENNGIGDNYKIFAWIYIADKDSGSTKYKITIHVNARAKPEITHGGQNGEMFQEAVEAVRDAAARASESEKQAEGWAHGREDLPERAEDNAKYYAGKASEDAKKTAQDRAEVEHLTESNTQIQGEVAKDLEEVKKLSSQAQTSATNAALSEQKSEEAATRAETAQAGAETAEDNAELAAQKTGQDKTAVEQAKKLVQQMGQEVLNNKNAVDKTVQDFNFTAQQALADVNNAGQTQTERVQSAGTTAVENIENAQNTATQAVQTAAQEIITDREQINANKAGVAQLKEDLSELSDTKVDKQDGYSMVSDSEKQAWNNKSDFSGSYNDLTDKPEIPEGADLTGYATEDYVKDYAQPKGNYLTEHQDLSGYALKEEIPTVPEKLPNPNPLTFTGAVTGSYDGSEAVNIDIPISSGGGDEKKVIYNQVLTENVGFVSVPFSEFSGCKRIICKIYIPKMEEETYKNYLIKIKLADTEAWSSGVVFAFSKDISTNTNHLLLMCSMFIVNEKAHFENMFYMDQYTKNPNNLINAASVQNHGYYLTTQNTSIYFEINNRTYLLPIGTEITILGY